MLEVTGKEQVFKAADALAEKMFASAMADCKAFIRDYVYFEDRDHPDVIVPFKLWPAQEEVIDTLVKERLVIIMKARQLGLTWLVLAYLVWRMLKHPGFSIVAVSKREEPDAKELIRRLVVIFDNLPGWMIRRVDDQRPFNSLRWDATTLTVTVHHTKKTASVFRSMTSAPDTARSFTANVVFLDEWAFQPWAEKIWASAYPTINRPTGGQVVGLSTMERGTLFEKIWDASVAGEMSFKPIFLPWNIDPRRTKEWREQTARDLPEDHDKEYPETPEQAKSLGSNAAFPEFTRQIHVVKQPFKIPHWWRRWRANDPGYTDPFAWYWFASGPDGKVYVYREYTRKPFEPKQTYSDQARQVNELSVMYDENDNLVAEDIAFTVTGRDAFNRHPETGKAIVDYYAEGGLTGGFIEPPRREKSDRIARKAALHEYLKPYKDENTGEMTAKLQIFPECQMLLQTLGSLEKDPNDAEKVKECSIDHWYDALGMGLVAWHSQTGGPPQKPLSKIAEHKEKRAKRLRYVKAYGFRLM